MLWQSAAPLIGKPKLSECLLALCPPQPSAQSRPRRQRPSRPSHGLVCGWQPSLPPFPPDSRICKHHPQAPLSSHVCPRKATSFAGRSLASYAAAAPLILPLHSLARSKHPLKPSGRSNIRNSILAAFLRNQFHQAKRLPRLSCGLIRGGSPGSPLPSPCDLFRSDTPTAVPANFNGSSPLPAPLHSANRSDAPCGSPVTSSAVAVPGSAPPSPRGLIGDDIPHSLRTDFLRRR